SEWVADARQLPSLAPPDRPVEKIEPANKGSSLVRDGKPIGFEELQRMMTE
ncbi:unnamed protein product, partial [Amoebophrya sp. A25]